ncbi:armadillo-type protein [Pelomyxa schiedti]|nr:armadillo-type protein [Pelomyxa schiedti]
MAPQHFVEENLSLAQGIGSLLFETVKGVKSNFNLHLSSVLSTMSKLLDWNSESEISDELQTSVLEQRFVVYDQMTTQMRHHVAYTANNDIWFVLEDNLIRVADMWAFLAAKDDTKACALNASGKELSHLLYDLVFWLDHHNGDIFPKPPHVPPVCHNVLKRIMQPVMGNSTSYYSHILFPHSATAATLKLLKKASSIHGAVPKPDLDILKVAVFETAGSPEPILDYFLTFWTAAVDIVSLVKYLEQIVDTYTPHVCYFLIRLHENFKDNPESLLPSTPKITETFVKVLDTQNTPANCMLIWGILQAFLYVKVDEGDTTKVLESLRRALKTLYSSEECDPVLASTSFNTLWVKTNELKPSKLPSLAAYALNLIKKYPADWKSLKYVADYMDLNKPTKLKSWDPEEVLEILASSLLVPHRQARKNALRVISHFLPESEVVNAMLTIDECRLNLEDEREIILQLEQIQKHVGTLKKGAAAVVCRFLLGVLMLKFTTVWDAAKKAFTLIAEAHPDSSWNVLFGEVLDNYNITFNPETAFVPPPHLILKSHYNAPLYTKEDREGSLSHPDQKRRRSLFLQAKIDRNKSADSSSTDLAPLFEKERDVEDLDGAVSRGLYSKNLWLLMRGLSRLAEQHHSDFLPFFFYFFDNEFRAHFRGWTDDFSGESSNLRSHVGTGLVSVTMEHILSILSAFRKLPQVPESERAKTYFWNILGQNEPELQKKAFSCLMKWKSPVTHYRNLLENMINIKGLSNGLEALRLYDPAVVKPEHRHDLIPYLIRILLPYVTSRGGERIRKGRVIQSLVFNFIGSFELNEMRVFLKYALHSYTQVLEGVPFEKVTIPVYKQVGGLRMIKLMITKLGLQLRKFLPCLLDPILYSLQFCLSGQGDFAGSCFYLVERILQQYPALDDLARMGRFLDICKDAIELMRAPKKISGLFHILMVISQNPALLCLLNKNPVIVPNILTFLMVKSVSPETKEEVLQFVERVMEGTVAKQNDAIEIVLANALAIIAGIKSLLFYKMPRSSYRAKNNWWKRGLKILEVLASFIKYPEQSSVLLGLLIDNLNRFGDDEDLGNVLSIILTLSKVSTLSSVIPALAPMFSSLANKGKRAVLMDSLKNLTKGSASLTPVVDAIAELNGCNPPTEPAFLRIKEWSRPLDSVQVSLFIHNMLWWMCSDDKKERTMATEACCKIICAAVEQDKGIILRLLKKTVVPWAYSTLTDSTQRHLRQGFLILLTIIGRCLESDFADIAVLATLGKQPAGQENLAPTALPIPSDRNSVLVALTSGVTVKRVTALKIIQAKLGDIPVRLITDTLIPMLCTFVEESSKDFEEYQNTLIQTVGMCHAHIPWIAYFRSLSKYINKIREGKMVQKAIAIIETIISNFNFQVQTSHSEMSKEYHASPPKRRRTSSTTLKAETKKSKASDDIELVDEAKFFSDEEGEEDPIEDESDSDGDSGEESDKTDRTRNRKRKREGPHKKEAKNTPLKNDELFEEEEIEDGDEEDTLEDKKPSEDIHEHLLSDSDLGIVLISDLTQLISDEDNRLGSLSTKIISPLVGLLMKLPPEAAETRIRQLITMLATRLRSKDQEARNIARETLVKVGCTLGPHYFKEIVFSAAGMLDKGFRVSVFSYTLHEIVAAIVPQLKPGDIDDAVPIISKACLDDITARAPSVLRNTPNLTLDMLEAQKIMSYDTLKLLASIVLFGNVSNSFGSVSLLLTPIVNLLRMATTDETALLISKIFKSLSEGFTQNPSVKLKNLLPFLHLIITSNTYSIHQSIVNDEETEEIQAEQASSQNARAWKTAAEASKASYLLPPPASPYHTGKVNTLSTAHHLAEFGLGMLAEALQKKGEIITSTHIKMLDPFIKVLAECLEDTHPVLVSLALQCLDVMLQYPIPTLQKSISKLYLWCINQLQQPTTEDTLRESCLRLIYRILRLERKAQENFVTPSKLAQIVSLIRPYVEMTSVVHLSQHRSVNVYAHKFGSGLSLKQDLSFRILQTIIYQRPDVMSMEFIEYLFRLMLSSPSAPVRSACEDCVFNFLERATLELSERKKFMDFTLANLEFPELNGRMELLKFVSRILANFPITELHKFSQLLFVSLSMAMSNESHKKIKTLIIDCIKTLVKRIDRDNLAPLFNLLPVWLEDKRKIGIKCTAVQLLGVMVTNAVGKLKGKIDTAMDLLHHSLEQGLTANRDQWELPFYCIRSVERIAYRHQQAFFGFKKSQHILSLVLEYACSYARPLQLAVSKFASNMFGYVDSSQIAMQLNSTEVKHSVGPGILVSLLSDCDKLFSLMRGLIWQLSQTKKENIDEVETIVSTLKHLAQIFYLCPKVSPAYFKTHSPQEKIKYQDMNTVVCCERPPGEENEDNEMENEDDPEEHQDSSDEKEENNIADEGKTNLPLIWLFKQLATIMCRDEMKIPLMSFISELLSTRTLDLVVLKPVIKRVASIEISDNMKFHNQAKLLSEIIKKASGANREYDNTMAVAKTTVRHRRKHERISRQRIAKMPMLPRAKKMALRKQQYEKRCAARQRRFRPWHPEDDLRVVHHTAQRVEEDRRVRAEALGVKQAKPITKRTAQRLQGTRKRKHTEE